jgi:hypothetical protein
LLTCELPERVTQVSDDFGSLSGTCLRSGAH